MSWDSSELGGVGYRVADTWERPASDVLEALAGIEVPNLADAQRGLGVLDAGMRALVPPTKRVVGPALTVSITPGNGHMIRRAIQMAQAGDVLVVNGGGNVDRAVVGGNVLMSAAAAGILAVIVDGAVRDVDEAARVGLPVVARAAIPRAGTDANGRGEVGYPVACGGAAVAPGDVVVLDPDGVVVVPRQDAAWVIENGRSVQDAKGSAADFDARWERARSAARIVS